MEIRWAVFDAAQREGFHWPQRCFIDEALNFQVMHLLIQIGRGRMTPCTLPLPEEDFSPRRSRSVA